MSTGPTSYFILIYNLGNREVLIEEWGGDDVGAAAAYTEREREMRERDDVEVVMVGADSLDTVKQTHSHYFATTTEDLFDQLLAALVPKQAHSE